MAPGEGEGMGMGRRAQGMLLPVTARVLQGALGAGPAEAPPSVRRVVGGCVWGLLPEERSGAGGPRAGRLQGLCVCLFCCPWGA